MEPLRLAGPDAIPFDEVVRQYLAAHNDPRTVVTDEQARYFGTPLEKRSLVPEGENRCSVPAISRTGLAAPLHSTEPLSTTCQDLNQTTYQKGTSQ